MKVRKYFMTYKPISDSSEAVLVSFFLGQHFDLHMNDYRSQGYKSKWWLAMYISAKLVLTILTPETITAKMTFINHYYNTLRTQKG